VRRLRSDLAAWRKPAVLGEQVGSQGPIFIFFELARALRWVSGSKIFIEVERFGERL
jgi:hypothetical protein